MIECARVTTEALHISPEGLDLLDTLKDAAPDMRTKAAAEDVGRSMDTVRRSLLSLETHGLVSRRWEGKAGLWTITAYGLEVYQFEIDRGRVPGVPERLTSHVVQRLDRARERPRIVHLDAGRYHGQPRCNRWTVKRVPVTTDPDKVTCRQCRRFGGLS